MGDVMKHKIAWLCACPYNSARNGSSCGGRSAWSRGGGYSPMCYPKDVSKADVAAYRASH